MKRILLLSLFTMLLIGCHPKEYYTLESQAAQEPSELVHSSGSELSEDQRSKTTSEAETEPHKQREPADLIILPTEGNESSEEAEASKEVRTDATLLFSGDVLLSNHVLNAYANAGGIHGVLDDGYRAEIAQADFFMVNQEFPFSNRGTQAPDKQYTFRLAPEKVALFHELDIDAVTLANNHALDYGQDALLDTCQVLDDAGILHTGAGANLDEAKQAVFTELAGQKISIIGATRVIPVADWAATASHTGMLATYDPTVLLEEIRTLSETQDYVIVMVHWGIERAEKPEAYQRALAKQMIDAGADLIIGAHPHVLQGIEYYNGKPIVYSLGNFIFGSSIPRTMLLKVSLTDTDLEEPNLKLSVIPGTSSGGFTKKHTDPATLQEFYHYLESISFGVTFDEDGGIQMP